MRKLILLAPFIISALFTNAQYCGNSGPAQCTADGSILQPGLSPMSDSLPPFENGVASTTVIQFRNFNTVFFGGQQFTLQSLTIDTIDNLPNGLCWASDRANNTYLNSENGCIKVNGTPCDSTGQYKLRIIATATTSFPVVFTAQVNAANVGLHYFVRLNNTGDPVTPVDTLQPESDPFYPYGGVCQGTPPAVSLGNDRAVCSGTSLRLNPAVTGGQLPFSYAWQSTGDIVSCDTCPNPLIDITQNSTFILTVTDSNGSSASDTVDVTAIAAPNVTVSPAGPVSVCQGTSVTLQASPAINLTFVWQRNGTNLGGATNPSYSALLAGTYRVVAINTSNCSDTSNAVVVNVHGLPSVSLSGNADTVCSSAGSFTLTGGTPAGGAYSGTGVTGNTFSPATAGVGSHTVSYSYTDGNNCTSSASETIVVRVCTGIDETETGKLISVYPNPAKNTLVVESVLPSVHNLNPQIYDITGRSVELSYLVKGNTITFDISGIPAGSYSMKMDITGKTISKRFVKEE